MLSSFFKPKPEENQTRIKEKIKSTTINFENRLKDIEHFANTFYEKTETYEKQINRFKEFCHNINILITDKDSDLKLIFANHTVCEKLYGLPNLCSELIENRFEWDVINDFIEKTGKWNSFVESQTFNIDEIVKITGEEKKFFQIGFIDSKKLILETTIKPHTIDNKFEGIMTIGNIVSADYFKRNINGCKLLHNKNEYFVWEVLKK